MAGDDPRLDLDLSSPDPVPDDGIEHAVALMRSGRLFRYGEDRSTDLETSALEQEFADYLGVPYCVAVNSGGSSMFLALKCAGVEPGDRVLVNAFTLAPVPGSVQHCGADTVFVECTDDCTIDLEDLYRKAETSGARVLLLSHMRGHIADMDAVTAACEDLDLCLIEDCAHTLGAKWDGRHTGTFGAFGCFSTQTFKHLNSGEGGLLVCSDDLAAARAVLMSGSYMLYEQHGARPPDRVFEKLKYQTPNFSLRMSALAASVLRPQLRLLEERAFTWRLSYAMLAKYLRTHDPISIPERSSKEEFVPSSLQFFVNGLDRDEIGAFVDGCADRGLHIKWFGRDEAAGFTATWQHWQYLREPQALERTAQILARLCDIRLPLSLTNAQCRTISDIVRASLP